MDRITDFPVYLPYNDRTYVVYGYAESPTELEFVDNGGYINPKDNCVYICSLNNPPVHSDVPIVKVTKTDDGWEFDFQNQDCVYVDMDDFDASNLYQLDLNSIINNTSGNEVLYNEEVLADMNAATTIFRPAINPKDDPFKKVIKQAIILMEIDITALKHKLPHKYALTNMKSALVGKTKMSVKNFMIWCELLNLHYEIILYSKDVPTSYKLKTPLHYNSETGLLEQE